MFELVFAVAAALHQGRVLQARDLSASRNTLIDWSVVRSGETLLADSDAFEVASLFVQAAGWYAVAEALDKAA